MAGIWGIWRIRIYFSDELALPQQGRRRAVVFTECVNEVNEILKQRKTCCKEFLCNIRPDNSIKYALSQRQQGESPTLCACETAVRQVLERNGIEVNKGQIIAEAE